MRAPDTLVAAVELGLRRLLANEADLVPHCAALDGRVVAVHILGLDMDFYVMGSAGSLHVSALHNEPVETVVRAGPLALARLALGGEAADQLFAQEVTIEGDVELGQHFQALLRGLEIDWEEQLSRVTGDVIAHQVGNVVRGGRSRAARAVDSLGRDLSEFLQYEHRDLPPRHEVERFLTAVDDLRSDTDRLQARIQRLQQRRASHETGRRKT